MQSVQYNIYNITLILIFQYPTAIAILNLYKSDMLSSDDNNSIIITKLNLSYYFKEHFELILHCV